MIAYLDWNADGSDWPNREASRFVEAADLRWHVQVMGEGPVALLLHGTGSSSHSWRDVMPRLAKSFTVVAPDLIVSFNGAYFPVTGVAGQFFSPLAKAVASAKIMRKLFASMADRPAVERLLRDTGSSIDARGLSLYQRLFSNEGHIAGTLGMMAAWDLHWVEQDLKNLPIRLYLVKALNDRTIPPANADRAARLAPRSTVITMAGLGHLAHEEDPEQASRIIADPDRALAAPPGK